MFGLSKTSTVRNWEQYVEQREAARSKVAPFEEVTLRLRQLEARTLAVQHSIDLVQAIRSNLVDEDTRDVVLTAARLSLFESFGFRLENEIAIARQLRREQVVEHGVHSAKMKAQQDADDLAAFRAEAKLKTRRSTPAAKSRRGYRR